MYRCFLANLEVDRVAMSTNTYSTKSVPRPRVQNRLFQACAERVALIVAPAGYGKSVALRDYLDVLRTPYVRFDVDESAENLSGFVRAFVDALGAFAPGARESLPDALRGVIDAEKPSKELALWLYPQFRCNELTIVVDDLHKAGSNAESSRFLAELIDMSKLHAITWLIATRTTLNLPVASWLAYGVSTTAIDEHDLSFDVADANAAAASFGLAISDEELSTLVKITDGWPAAIVFALRSSTQSSELKTLAAPTREMIFQYFAEQVYLSISDSERDLLRDAALLNQIDVRILELLGHDRAEAIMEELRHAVPFILLQHPGRYRMHDLFRDFIEYESRLLGSINVHARLKRVALGLEQSGRVEESLILFQRAQDWKNIERLVDQHGFDLVALGASENLEKLVNAAPDSMRNDNSTVVGLRAGFQYDRRRFDEAERLYLRALSLPNEVRKRARLALSLTYLLIGNGRTDSLPFLEDPILYDETDPSVRADVAGALAVIYGYKREIQKCRTMIDRSRAVAQHFDDNANVRSLSQLGVACFFLGDYDAAERYAAQGAAIACEIGQFRMAVRCFSSLYAVSSMRGQNERALHFAQNMVEAANKCSDRFMLNRALLSSLDIYSQMGEKSLVSSTLKTLTDTFGEESLNDHYALEVLSIQSAWNGHFERAVLLMTSSLKSTFDVSHAALRQSLLAIYFAVSDQREKADTAIDAAVNLVNSGNSRDRLTDFAMCFTAIASVLLGRRTVAKKYLKKIPVNDAAKIMWTTALHFIDRAGNDPHQGLRDSLIALEHAGFAGYAALLRELPTIASSSDEVSLTKAEAEVLTLLDSGKRPKAIAESTGRSVYTVQNHIRSIISKLGASGRDEALSRARQRNLIPGTATHVRALLR